jgi:adenosylmethionine-8-amino-7-oxononanoate aminotransferase
MQILSATSHLPAMSHLLHRQILHPYTRAVSGAGICLRDENGRSYIDACSSAGVSCLGHQHPQVLAAMHAQLAQLAYAHSSFFTSDVAEALGDELITHAPPGMSHAYLVSGGSEAMEAALKMARQYFVERGEPQRRHFIALRQSDHGNTLGALSVSGNAWRRAQFAPLIIDNAFIDPCYAYRLRASHESLSAYGLRSANALEAKITELGAENVIAFVAETVIGATLGAVPPVAAYLRRIREICDQYDILLILDEVMCGMGRTGSLHACTQEDVVPDLLTIAKGLGGGYAPIGATLVGAKIFDRFAKGAGHFQHGHTFLAHPLACAAALAVQRVIREQDLLTNVQIRGHQLEAALRARFDDHPAIGDIRGRGLFWGLELVADRRYKTPFEPEQRMHAKIRAEAMARGLMVYPMGGTINGHLGDHILLAPPFISDHASIEAIVERLGDTVDAVMQDTLALSL